MVNLWNKFLFSSASAFLNLHGISRRRSKNRPLTPSTPELLANRLFEEEIALDVDAIVLEEQDLFRKKTREHVADCTDCKVEVIEVLELIEPAGPHRMFDNP